MGIVEGTSFTPKLKPYKPVGRPKPDRHWTQDAMGVIGVARALGPLFDSAATAISRGAGQDDLLEAIAAEEERRTALDQGVKVVPGLTEKQAADPMERFKANQQILAKEQVIDTSTLAEIESFGPQYLEEKLKGMGAPGVVPSMNVLPESLLQEQAVAPLPAMPRPADTAAARFYDVGADRAMKQKAKQKSAIPDLLSLYRMSLDELRNLAQWGLSSDPTERLIEMKRLNKAASAVGKAELGASGFFSALGGDTGEARGRSYVLKDAKTQKDLDQMQAARDAQLLESGAIGIELNQRKLDKLKAEDEKKATRGKGPRRSVGSVIASKVMYNQAGEFWVKNPNNATIDSLNLTGAEKKRALSLAKKHSKEKKDSELTVNDFVQGMRKTPKGKKHVNLARREAKQNRPGKKERQPAPKPPLTSKEEGRLRTLKQRVLRDFGQGSNYTASNENLNEILNRPLTSPKNVRDMQNALAGVRSSLRRDIDAENTAKTNNSDYPLDTVRIEGMEEDIKRINSLIGLIRQKQVALQRGGPSATAPAAAPKKDGRRVRKVPMSELNQ